MCHSHKLEMVHSALTAAPLTPLLLLLLFLAYVRASSGVVARG